MEDVEPPENECNKAKVVCIILLMIFLMMWMISSCTISFQNVSTHGQATDLIDQDQKNDPTVSTDLDIPLSKGL